ncbi:MAG: hypothetical protein ABI614_29160, partial [Planctomycetota bacterium]
MSSPPSGPSVFDGIPSLYDGIAKIYRWDWNAGNAGAFETQPLLANEFLSAFGGSAPGNKKTILLTHGWNDKLDHGADDEFMSRFARDLMLGRTANEIASEYSVLAVDWYGEGLRRVLGSNPNLLPPIIDFISPYGAFDDALKSSVNGINIGKVLANELRAAGIGPAHLSNLMLIGHSNGAGFMGSLAKKLFQLTGEK